MERNWVWLAGMAGLVVAAGACTFVGLALGFMRSSEAYAEAVVRARSSPAVIAALGDFVCDGFWFTGHISVSGSSGHADFAIPLSGPKAQAVLYVTASRSAGQWRHDLLVVKPRKNTTIIDLKADEIPNRSR